MDTLPDKSLLLSCPWYLIARSPAVHEVASLYWWRNDGAINRNDLPVCAIHAIDAYAAGVNAATQEIYKPKDKTK